MGPPHISQQPVEDKHFGASSSGRFRLLLSLSPVPNHTRAKNALDRMSRRNYK